ncbi:hypothetical protein ACFL1M_03015 [Patescibacteria group bacterium]
MFEDKYVGGIQIDRGLSSVQREFPDEFLSEFGVSGNEYEDVLGAAVSERMSQ